MSDTIRVLLAEDSPTVRQYLTSLIQEMPGFEVVGTAVDGAEVVEMVQQIRPDVVSMDIKMPHMDGLEATRQIMAHCPTPVVVVSGMLEKDIALSMNALEAGALAVIPKPPDRKNPAFNTRRNHLMTTLKAMAAVSVVSRRERLEKERENQEIEVAAPPRQRRTHPEILVIGASTGGPSALHHLLRDLPDDYPLPIVVAQHMPAEFIGGLARWLRQATALDVRLAENGLTLQPGMVVLAPGDYHIIITRRGTDLVVRLIEDSGAHRYQPSVDVLFNSVAHICGSAAIGLILTGMGDDGAAGLLAMHEAGAYTLAQDEASATVFGMPQAAIKKGAVQTVISLADLPFKLMKLL